MRTKEFHGAQSLESLDERARGRPSHYFFPGLSIRHRLPLMIAILLCGVMVASTWASYRGVRDSSLEVGRERLVHLTEQLVGLLQQQSATLTGKTYTVANDPAILAYLLSPSAIKRPSVTTLLQQFTDPQDINSIQVELWNADRA